MFRLSLLACLMLALGAVGLTGCEKSDAADKAAISKHRDKFLLAEEPAGAKGVIDTREEMPRQGEMVVVGKVGGRADIFTKGQARFFMADASVSLVTDGHQHKEGEECAYCRDKANATKQTMIAIVQFVDDDGNVVPASADELFDIKANDTIVVRGRAHLGEDDWLIIAAKGLYVRR